MKESILSISENSHDSRQMRSAHIRREIFGVQGRRQTDSAFRSVSLAQLVLNLSARLDDGQILQEVAPAYHVSGTSVDST
jgi:hypothetical protein